MIRDEHLKNVFMAVDKRVKLLQKQMGKVNGNKFVKGQEKFVFENMMPPMIQATVTSYSRPILMLQCNKDVDFTQDDIDIILDYLDNKVYNVIRNPNATQNELREAFLRMTCFAYMIEMLIDFLLEHNLVYTNPKFIQHCKSHTSALINFISSIQERAVQTGKIGFSGSNMAEIDEFAGMINGMLSGIPVCDWYQAYLLIFNRFLCNRIGGTVEDWDRP